MANNSVPVRLKSTSPYFGKPEVQREVALAISSPVHGVELQTSQRQIIRWTGPTYELFGYEVTDIVSTGEWWEDQIHPDDRGRILTSLSEHLARTSGHAYDADSRMWRADYRFRRADGTYVLLCDRTITTRSEDGEVISFTSVVYDLHERQASRKAHLEKLQSEDYLAIVAKNTPSGIFMMDPQGYATYMNDAAEQITGFTFEELYGYTFHAAVHSCRPNGDPYPKHECPVFRAQQEGKAAQNETEVFVHKNGQFYDIVYSVSPIGDYASGGSVIEFRDVTDTKRLENERLTAILKNEEQSIRIKESENHKADMASFVSFVCHELRNPLQGVTSSAEFLGDTLNKLESLTKAMSSFRLDSGVEPPLPVSNGRRNSLADMLEAGSSETPRRTSGIVDASALATMDGLIAYAKELVSNIATCAQHQALITNNVLDLSRLDAGKVEPSLDVVDIQDLGQRTVDMMLARAKAKTIHLSMVDKMAPPLYLKADTTLLSQVLLNLVSNAIKFTPENGRIMVDVYSDPPTKDGRVVLHGSVTDNGLGMTEGEQERLFKRFSQANRKVAQLYGGSGLGLSISKELVTVMGGEMSVQSEYGKGSTFSFTTLHDPPTRHELLDFLRLKSQKDDDGRNMGHALSLSELPAVQVPPFKTILVAEDNP